MNSEYKVSASIVLYKTPEHQISGILESLKRVTLPISLYIIDNSPTDDLKPYFENENVTYIKSENNGYGTGHNIALHMAVAKSSDYHVILNPDIRFESGVIEALIEKMSREDGVGSIMPRVTSPEGETQYLCKLLPDPRQLIFRRFLPWGKKKMNYTYEMRYMNYEAEFDAPVLSGCFMFLDMKKISTVGFFDERYFMYMEDVDFSRRIGASYRNLYYPEVHIIHDHGRESYKFSKMTFEHIKSAVQYFNKWGWVFDKHRRKINTQFSRQDRATDKN